MPLHAPHLGHMGGHLRVGALAFFGNLVDHELGVLLYQEAVNSQTDYGS
jgi:hypothetical protein